MAAGILRLPLGALISTPQTVLLRRGSAAIPFCNFCFPSARESAEGHAALFHNVPHNCTALLPGSRLQNSPSLLRCSEYAPCCFKNLSWIRLSLMELRGSVGSAKLGLKVVSAGESHRTSFQEIFVTFFGTFDAPLKHTAGRGAVICRWGEVILHVIKQRLSQRAAGDKRMRSL